MATQLAYSVNLDTPGCGAPTPYVVAMADVSMRNSERFIAAWDDLARHASEPNAFNESWYLLPALDAFDTLHAVQLFTMWQGAAFESPMIALMPLASSGQYGRWPVPHLQNWLHHNAFLGTPLVRRNCELAFWQALLPVLDASPGRSLFFHINGMTSDGPVKTALVEHCTATGRNMGNVHHEYRALLEGTLSPAAYLETAVRGKKRKELRRQKNRLAEEGVLVFERYTDSAGLDEWISAFLALERSGWKGDNGSALDCSDQTRTLFRTALRGAAAQGRLERLDLRLDGRPLVMLVNFLSFPGSFSFKTAFDESYARFSPGVLLQIENLDLLNRTDIDWCDSCAAEGHPMIDSLWTGRRGIGRYSVAIGGHGRRGLFSVLLRAELARMKNPLQPQQVAIL